MHIFRSFARVPSSKAIPIYPSTATAAKSLQSCPTLCDPIDSSPPGSSVPGILQVRKLEWVAISFSNGWKWKVKGKSLSRVRLLATPWTAAYQAPQSTGFSSQEYWSGVPSPSPILPLIVHKITYFLVPLWLLYLWYHQKEKRFVNLSKIFIPDCNLHLILVVYFFCFALSSISFTYFSFSYPFVVVKQNHRK